MVRRFRIWEMSIGIQSQQLDSPTRSTGVNASHSDSFITISGSSDVQGSKGAATAPSYELRKRQLIVAVTANSAECEKVNDGGFDEICSKPLTRADIHKVITRHFQYE